MHKVWPRFKVTTEGKRERRQEPDQELVKGGFVFIVKGQLYTRWKPQCKNILSQIYQRMDFPVQSLITDFILSRC